MKKLNRYIFKAVLVAFLPVLSLLYAFRTVSSANEYAVKAMFIYNFTKYLDWTRAESNSEFNIAVYGNSEIIKYLKEIAIRKNVNGKHINVTTIFSLQEATSMQVVFIPEIYSSVINELAGNPKLKSVLLITEHAGSIRKGAHINFIQIDGKMKFEMNETAMKKDGVGYSKELESLAVKIY
ncbi:MAG TPA: YfiR family protein [Bacteroidia bacterium]|nr:YfiR family protein [Bacteroidia bacterium]